MSLKSKEISISLQVAYCPGFSSKHNHRSIPATKAGGKLLKFSKLILPKQNWKVDKFEKAKTWSHVWLATQKFLRSVYGLTQHSVKSVRIWSFSGLYFLAFGRNTEIYSAYLRMQPECGKLQTRKTPNTKLFHAVQEIWWLHYQNDMSFSLCSRLIMV